MVENLPHTRVNTEDKLFYVIKNEGSILSSQTLVTFSGPSAFLAISPTLALLFIDNIPHTTSVNCSLWFVIFRSLSQYSQTSAPVTPPEFALSGSVSGLEASPGTRLDGGFAWCWYWHPMIHWILTHRCGSKTKAKDKTSCVVSVIWWGSLPLALCSGITHGRVGGSDARAWTWVGWVKGKFQAHCAVYPQYKLGCHSLWSLSIPYLSTLKHFARILRSPSCSIHSLDF